MATTTGRPTLRAAPARRRRWRSCSCFSRRRGSGEGSGAALLLALARARHGSGAVVEAALAWRRSGAAAGAAASRARAAACQRPVSRPHEARAGTRLVARLLARARRPPRLAACRRSISPRAAGGARRADALSAAAFLAMRDGRRQTALHSAARRHRRRHRPAARRRGPTRRGASVGRPPRLPIELRDRWHRTALTGRWSTARRRRRRRCRGGRGGERRANVRREASEGDVVPLERQSIRRAAAARRARALVRTRRCARRPAEGRPVRPDRAVAAAAEHADDADAEAVRALLAAVA